MCRAAPSGFTPVVRGTEHAAGDAILRVGRFQTIDEAVFAQKGDPALLGSRAMEGMNVNVDARRKRLAAAGPVAAA